MAISRNSDSLSRCDPNLYSNMYDIRSHANAKPETKYTSAISKDTIEISKDKIKEDALNRLRHTSKFVIPQNQFFRIGKYLFLAIALPPYFVVVTLPKWILIEAIPYIYSTTVWFAKEVKKRVEGKIKTGIQKLSQVIVAIQKMTLAFIQPIIHTATKIAQRLNQQREKIRRAIRKSFGTLASYIEWPFRKIKEKMNQAKRRFTNIKEKLSEFIQEINSKINNTLEWIKQSPQAFLGWGQGQITFLKEKFFIVRTKWISTFQSPLKWADDATKWISTTAEQGMQKGKEFLKSQFSPFVNVYRKNIQEPIRRFKEIFLKKWVQLKDFSQNKHKRAQTFINEQQEKLKKLNINNFIQYILSHPWTKKLPFSLQKWIKIKFSHPYIQLMIRGGIKFYSLSAKFVLFIASNSLKLISKGTEWVNKGYQIIQTFITRTGKQLSLFLTKGEQILKRSLLRLLYYTLLFGMILVILFIWTLHWLSNNANGLMVKKNNK